ncbi:MAG TPA: hypothetical protein VEL28_22525 [Candidatus Binatia bacterium]|nr:hypothetical protein [Candidatus Binatia bacterium]
MAMLAIAAASFGHEPDGSSIDAADLAEHSDFVFKGTVTNVAYRDSEPNPLLDGSGNPVLDRNGAPVIQDGSNLAHTFVTFTVEKVYKGRTEDSEVTLRFRGGVQEELVPETDDTGNPVLSEQIYIAGQTPLFDVGDREILFVQGNGDKPCPLAGGPDGRFRLIDRDPTAFGDQQVYSNLGLEISRISPPTVGAPPSARLGPPHELAEVNSTTMGGGIFEIVKGPDPVVADSEGDVPPDPAAPSPPQFLEAEFDDYLEAVVADDPSAPAFVSADITLPFFGRPSLDVRPAPKVRESRKPEPRPWLDELPPSQRRAIRVAEREEKKAFRRNAGNPVLPLDVVPQ